MHPEPHRLFAMEGPVKCRQHFIPAPNQSVVITVSSKSLISTVYLIDRRELNSRIIHSQFLDASSRANEDSRVLNLFEVKKKKISRQHHRRTCDGIFRGLKTVYLYSRREYLYFNPRRNNIPRDKSSEGETTVQLWVLVTPARTIKCNN